MKKSLQTLFFSLIIGLLWPIWGMAAPENEVSYEVLCYHDIRDNVDGNLEQDTTLISTKHLAGHLNWLHAHGYHPITIDDLLNAQKGIKPLPEKPVLLTFDDGYKSFYTHAYPLLKLFKYPAVLALTGSWLDANPKEMVKYGDDSVPRENFLSPEQIKEMAASGLIEFSSHSYDLHKSVLLGPFGSTGPAATTHLYLPDSKKYETDAEYQARIRNDLKHNAEFIQKLTGKPPRSMTWPYGRYNQTTIHIAKELGMLVTFTLDSNAEFPDTVNELDKSSKNNRNHVADLSKINRNLIEANPNEQALIDIFKKKIFREKQRIVHVDLDYVYDHDEAQMAKNIDQLIERIKSLAPSAVYLQAFADPDGDGVADALYFPNRHLPVRADIFNRVARQLSIKARVNVYAWMPVLAYDLPDKTLQTKLSIVSLNKAPEAGNYRRLSPFSDEARSLIKEIYEDLATHAMFDGLLFHDDVTLSEDEDDSSYAHQVYEQKWLMPRDILSQSHETEIGQKFTALKSRWLTDFTLELADTVRVYQPSLKTARNLYASTVTSPNSERWLAQNYVDALSHYDYTVIMAMPKLEKITNPMQWLTLLVNKARASPEGIKKTIFEIQTVDWASKRPIPDTILTNEFELLINAGAENIGYYSDDFIRNQPDIESIRPYLSIRSFPYLPK
jgi:poly-beta-1,6-N-acetyl-D-glucosamine N-deacetylase